MEEELGPVKPVKVADDQTSESSKIAAEVAAQAATLLAEARVESDKIVAEAHAIVTAGQRKVNMLWEYTQSIIAIFVTIATVSLAAATALKDNAGFPEVLTSMTFLILGFYFSRTNHQAIGGVGEKPTQEYKGR